MHYRPRVLSSSSYRPSQITVPLPPSIDAASLLPDNGCEIPVWRRNETKRSYKNRRKDQRPSQSNCLVFFSASFSLKERPCQVVLAYLSTSSAIRKDNVRRSFTLRILSIEPFVPSDLSTPHLFVISATFLIPWRKHAVISYALVEVIDTNAYNSPSLSPPRLLIIIKTNYAPKFSQTNNRTQAIWYKLLARSVPCLWAQTQVHRFWFRAPRSSKLYTFRELRTNPPVPIQNPPYVRRDKNHESHTPIT